MSDEIKDSKDSDEIKDVENILEEEAKKIEAFQENSDRKSILFDDDKGDHTFRVESQDSETYQSKTNANDSDSQDSETNLSKDESETTDKSDKKGLHSADGSVQSGKTKNSSQYNSRSFLMKNVMRRLKMALTLVPIAFVFLLVAAVIIQLTVFAATKAQTAQYLKETDIVNVDLNERINEVNDEYVASRIFKILKQNDLYVYTNSLWDYSLTANGVAVNDMEVSSPADGGKMVIILTEEGKVSPLPNSVVKIGSVTRGDSLDKIDRHISIALADGAKVEPIVEIIGGKSIYKFDIDGVKIGDEFVITLSDQMGAKLGMPFTEISVNVVK